MNCPVCSAPGDASDRFCRRCGCVLTIPCTRCHQTLRAGDRFCGACGAELAVSEPVLATAHVLTGDVAPDNNGSLLEISGERKVVTVMFADIVGSTRLIEGLDPEQSIRLLAPALDIMFNAVHRYEGTINRVQGDGIMALFGAPLAHEDHAVRACLAALALAKEAATLAASGIRIRVGLNSGPVVVRSFANDRSMDYDAIGPTVHLAARMEQSCPPGSVLVSANTYRLADHAVAVRPLGAQVIRGLNALVETYELLDETSPRKRLARAPRPDRSRFVGRAPESSALRQSMELSAVGFGQVVSVIGPAGIGKSRLVLEFGRTILPESWQRITCGGTPYDQNTGHHSLRSLMRSWAGIGELDDEAQAVAKIKRAAAALDAPLDAELPAIFSLLDLPVDDPSWRLFSPSVRQQRMAAAFVNLIVAISRQNPLAVIVEDLHWVDAATHAVLTELVRRIADEKVLLICTMRESGAEVWSADTDTRRIELQSLERPHARALLDGLLGDDASLESLKQRVIERSAGIPLFIEEISNSLIEAGDLSRGERGYRLNQPIDSIRIPESLQTLLASRIDRIDARLKRALQIGAVIGEEIPPVILAHMLDMPATGAMAQLRQLEQADFLRRVAPDRDLAFAFKHALLRDVAYGGLLNKQRTALHRAAVAALEAHPAAQPDERIERLAYHAVAGEMWREAAEYCRKAAERAHERSALNDAIRLLEQAVDALDRLPPETDVIEQRIDRRVQLRQALWSVGKVAEANAHLDTAEGLAETLGDKTRTAALGVIKTQILNSEGDLEQAIAAGWRAHSVAQAAGSENLAIAAEFFVSQSYFFQGDLRQVIAILQPALPRIVSELRGERLGTSTTTSVLYLVNLARAHALLGNFGEAEPLVAEAETIAREVERRFDLGFALHARGSVAVAAGNYENAVRLLEPALEICRTNGFRTLLPLVASPLGFALAALGEAKRGAELVNEATLIARRSRLIFFATWSAAFAARTQLQLGALIAARDIAENALPSAIEHKFRCLEVWLRRVAGLAATDSEATGILHLRRAADLAAKLGTRPDLAHCRLALAEIYHRLGRTDDAISERHAAENLYRSLGMHDRFPLRVTSVG